LEEVSVQQAWRPRGLDLIVVLSNGTVSTSTVTAHTTSGSDEPFREDVSVILTVSVDEEEHECETKLGGAAYQLGPLYQKK
jgi:hypothetical protein